MNRIASFSLAALAWLAAPGAFAELSVEQYCEVNIAYLELAAATWDGQGRPPTDAELDRLWALYGTDAREFLGYNGEHRTAVADYLEAHPEVQAEIDRLGAYLDALLD